MNKKSCTFPVMGMSCAVCAAHVGKALDALDGVEAASVNLVSNTARVVFDADKVSPEAMRQAVQNAGYDLLPDASSEEVEDARDKEYREQKRRMIWSVCLAIPIMIVGMGFHHREWSRWVCWIASTPVVFWLGRQFFVSAWRQLKHGSSNMDTLVAFSTAVAYLFSCFNLFFPSVYGAHAHVYFESAAGIITFILVGRTLEARAKVQTGSAIKKLMGLQPRTVTVLREGQKTVCPILEVVVGDQVYCRAGDKVAVDGEVVDGDSYIDESMLSGEPASVHKTRGDQVFTGTVNKKGTFVYRADRIGRDTVLSQIIRTVQQAQGSKAPVQTMVDKVAAIFVPAIIGIAFVALVVWLVFDPSPQSVPHAILALATVLIIACPCALGLATPTALMVGIGKGAENGILVKDAVSLEVARKIDTVVVDKTGTLTEGIVTEEGLVVGDRLRSTSRAAVQELQQMGLEVIMLTGDKENAAHAIADEAGIKRVVAGVLPNGKNTVVKQLQQEGRMVAMVGDGINDSAALAQADLSIAMGSGSDIAMDAAMITILRNDLLAVPSAIRLSRATVTTIRENLFWAFIYNIVAVPIAAGVLYPVNGFLLNPMIGSAAMAFSSVSVVLNSLRLRRKNTSSNNNSPETGIEDNPHPSINKNSHAMTKKEYNVEGMMCPNCVKHVSDGLNALPGVKAEVSLEDKKAIVEFSGLPLPLETLQQAIGDYGISEQ